MREGFHSSLHSSIEGWARVACYIPTTHKGQEVLSLWNQVPYTSLMLMWYCSGLPSGYLAKITWSFPHLNPIAPHEYSTPFRPVINLSKVPYSGGAKHLSLAMHPEEIYKIWGVDMKGEVVTFLGVL